MKKSLRELAKEYARELIDKDTYRKTRGELIRGICAYDIEVKDREYLKPVKISMEDMSREEREELEATIRNATSKPSPEDANALEPEALSDRKKLILYWAGGAILLSLVILAVAFIF